jgi:hypothetical protein
MQTRVGRWFRLTALVGMSAGAWSCGSDTANKPAMTAAGSGAIAGSPGSGSGSAGVDGPGGSAGAMMPVGNGVTITPANARVAISGNVQFQALVTGKSDMGVTWSVTEGMNGGTVSNTGLYTAPASSGSFHVVAASTADSTLMGVATVTVAAASGQPPVLKPGTWADLTPPGLNLKCCPGQGGNSYGIPYFDIDPGDPRTLYVCVDQLGLWKTTDGGSTWALLGNPKDTPSNTATTYLDSPIAIKVDPKDSNHLYATQGVRGVTQGFWVSHDAGKSWTKPQGFVDVSKLTTNDVTVLEIDPTDFNHALVGSHSSWPGLTNAGFVETKDGGTTWIAHQPQSSWPNGSMGIHFLYSPELGLGDGKTWLVSTDGNGFWKTSDAGQSWKVVAKDINIAHGGNQLYYSKAGWLYAGATNYPARSKDNGDTWESLKNLGYNPYYTVYGDGTTLYTQKSYTGTNTSTPAPYYTSPEADGSTWTLMPGGQTFIDGPFMMKFDSANKIMYSSNWDTGFVALKVQ